jgi:methyltransferase (TIGR00027 family)
MAVAFARAVVTHDTGAPGEGLDPFARDFLPRSLAAVVDATPPALARALSSGIVDHIELRSLAIDAVAEDALGSGTRQMVILGAGLDARAWRLDDAARGRTFEVDHPATQRYKRRRAPDSARDVVFVSVDFARESLDARLEVSGHDRRIPTLWIWEGVTMYLPLEATRATLGVVRARSAPRSTLAVTYGTPEMTNGLAGLKGLVRPAFAALGEALLGFVDPAHFAAMLEEAGFAAVDDGGSEAWGARFGSSPRVRIAERLAVARTT